MSAAARDAGFSEERLARIRPFVQWYIDSGRHFGAEIVVARNGHVAFHEALGYRGADRSQRLEKGAVYSIFSVSKTFTSILSLNAVEQGHFSLTTKVSEIIPEFSGGRRENI